MIPTGNETKFIRDWLLDELNIHSLRKIGDSTNTSIGYRQTKEKQR